MSRHYDVKFYVHVRRDRRWTIEALFEVEPEAVAHARRLLSSRGVEAVKVIKEDSRYADKEIFREEAPQLAQPPALALIDSVPPCTDLDDVYRFEALKAIGRMLRAYLDRHVVSPVELMHCPGHLKRLMSNDMLFNAALHRAAAAQAEATGSTPRERAAVLYDLAEAARQRTASIREVARFAAELERGGLAALLERVRTDVPPAEQAFYVRAAIADRLATAGSWETKLVLMLDAGAELTAASDWRFADETIALILDGAKPVMEVLGPQPSLGDALCTLIRVGSGTWVPRGSPPVLDRLAAALAARGGAATQAVLLERVQRTLVTTRPLTRDGQAAEQAAFERIVRTLGECGELPGGGAMGEAVSRRAQLVFRQEDDDLPVRQALDTVLGMLPSRLMRAKYLLDLSATGLSRRHDRSILECFADFMRRMALDSAQGLSPADRQDIVLAIAAIEARLRAGGLSQEWSRLLARETAQLLSAGPVAARA